MREELLHYRYSSYSYKFGHKDTKISKQYAILIVSSEVLLDLPNVQFSKFCGMSKGGRNDQQGEQLGQWDRLLIARIASCIRDYKDQSTRNTSIMADTSWAANIHSSNSLVIRDSIKLKPDSREQYRVLGPQHPHM